MTLTKQQAVLGFFLFAFSLILPSADSWSASFSSPPVTIKPIHKKIEKLSGDQIINSTTSSSSLPTDDVLEAPKNISTQGIVNPILPDHFQVSLNGLQALTQKILPAVAQQSDLNNIVYEMPLPEYYLDAFNTRCYLLKTTLKFAISLPIKSDSVSAHFESDRHVVSSWNFPDATIKVDGIINPIDISNSVKCVGWDLLNAFIGDEHTATATGISGDIDAKLKLGSSSALSLSKIYQLDFAFNDIQFSNSSALDWLVDYVTSWESLFSELLGFSCDSKESCVEAVLNNELNKGQTREDIVDLLGDSLSTDLAVSGGVSEDSLNLDYKVALTQLYTSNDDTLKAIGSLSLDSDVPEDDCASQILETKYVPKEAVVVGSDIDVFLPFPVMMRPLFMAAKRGVFCADLTGTFNSSGSEAVVHHVGGESDFSEVMPLADSVKIPLTLDYDGTLIPNGALEIASADETDPDLAGTIYIRVPFLINVNATLHDSGLGKAVEDTVEDTVDRIVTEAEDRDYDQRISDEVKQTMSELDGVIEEKVDDVISEYTEVENQSEISGVMLIASQLAVDCSDGLYLDLESVTFENLEGDVNLGFTKIPAEKFADRFKEDIQKSIDEKIPYLTLLPKVTNITGLGDLGIEIDDVVSNDAGLGIGLNVVERAEDSTCVDE